jgi:TRAP-type mannitol/chloroaromatic compound transport system substrate-binding protein
MDRRKFVKTAGLAGAAGLLGACQRETGSAMDCGPVTAAEPIEWKMVTAWPRDFPALGTGANHLADMIGKLSDGRLTVKVYGGNELVPPFEVVDAVERGTAEMGHGAPYYWKGKVPSAQFFAGVPFGMTAREMNGWIYHGGGLDLWHEAYAPFGILPFPVGNSDVQMGGWFNKEINSVADLQGLKMRIPGLGGEVLRRAGGTPQSIPVAEIFTALQTGTIDASEWIGPYNDQAAGLFRAARYYYYPGWHEPGTVLEGLVNRAAYDALPEYLQQVVVTACKAATLDMLSEFSARNGDALANLREQQVEIRAFPEDVLRELKRLTPGVLEEIAREDEMSARVYASFKAYMAKAREWTRISETIMLNQRDPGA